MKTIGIIGGISPESTVEYYKYTISTYQEKLNTNEYPNLIINSIDLSKVVNYISSNNFQDLVEYFKIEIDKLKKAEADFGIIAANTPHIVFDKIQENSSLQLLSIIEATCEKVAKSNVNKVGLFGTKFTMTGDFYQKSLEKRDIRMFIPEVEEMDVIHSIYMDELVKAIFLKKSKRMLINIANKMIKKYKIEGLILGGTELPLILKQNDIKNVQLFDTTKIHVEAAIEYAIH